MVLSIKHANTIYNKENKENVFMRFMKTKCLDYGSVVGTSIAGRLLISVTCRRT
jgi:hypothetical protein